MKNYRDILAVLVFAVVLCLGVGLVVQAVNDSITVNDGGVVNINNGGNQGGPGGDLGVGGQAIENYVPAIMYNDGFYTEKDMTVVGTITGTTISGAISASILSATGVTQLSGVESGRGALQLATSSGTTILTEAQFIADSFLEIMINTGSTATIQLPATSTMTTILQTVGKHEMRIIHNATSSTMALTITKGAGIDLIGVTTNDDVIDSTEYSILDCWRKPNTDVVCRISEELHVD